MMKANRFLTVLTLAILSVVPATAGKGGGKPGGEAPPPDPVLVFGKYPTIDVLNSDFSNQTTVWMDEWGGFTGGRWIPGTNWVFFAEYDRTIENPNPEDLQYLYQRVEVQVVDGQVFGGPPVLVFESYRNTFKPSWHWGPNGGEILYYRALSGTPDALEIVQLNGCDANCTPDPPEVLYQAPGGWGLNYPIRSMDGSKVWAVEYHDGEPYQERIIQIDRANSNSYSVIRDLVLEIGNGPRLASARTFNGFAYKDGPDTHVYDADVDEHFFVTTGGNPLTFSADDRILVVSKVSSSNKRGLGSKLTTTFVHWLETPVLEETMANWTALFDWKH